MREIEFARFQQRAIETERLILEPITAEHSEEIWCLFGDPELHTFVPMEPLSMEEATARCKRWETRRSPDGSELWLNWLARENVKREAMAHFQIGVKKDTATLGYLVARKFQSKGLAFEGISAVFDYLKNDLGIKEVCAWSDTRNKASHRLAEKLGMVQIELIKNADYFKGSASDELVFSKILKS